MTAELNNLFINKISLLCEWVIYNQYCLDYFFKEKLPVLEDYSLVSIDTKVLHFH